jgi:formylglycine-generating enzyme required for sulfatase activity
MSLKTTIAALALITLTSGCAHMQSAKAPTAPDGMVLVSAGPFIMGTDGTDEDSAAADYGLPYNLYGDANPSFTADLPAFFIDKYELTNAEYLQFLDITELPQATPGTWTGNRPAEGTSDQPVTGINWYQAMFACNHFGKRLPSEAEWEKAARGADGNIYPWGNEFDETKANVAKGDKGKLMPVGSFPQGASVYGVEDMIGNAWEWTKSWYRPYPNSTYEDDKFGQKQKVIRGNSYGDHGHYPDEEARRVVVAEMSRANYRFSFSPRARTKDSGVRCAMDVIPKAP